MSTVLESSQDPVDVSDFSLMHLRPTSVVEFQRMFHSGVFGDDEQLELLDGWIVKKRPHTPCHSVAIELANEAVRPYLPKGWRCRIRMTILTTTSLPDPDLAIVFGDLSAHQDRWPNPSETTLIIEVSDSTLAQDRKVKARVYAHASIPCYWIANLIDGQLEVHSEPSGPSQTPGYAKVEILQMGDVVPLIIGGQEVARLDVQSLLP